MRKLLPLIVWLIPSVAYAQLGIGINHDASLKGTGSTASPLGVRADCTTSDFLLWNGSAWVCSGYVAGDITAVTAGSGLTGGGASGAVTLDIGAGTGITVAADSISVNTAVIQARVSGTCSGNDGILSIAADGSVTCATGTGDITAVTAGTGLSGGGSSGAVSLAVSLNGGVAQSCSAGDAIVSLSATGIVTCDTAGITNSAGVNVIMKSDGTNAVGSSWTDDGTTTAYNTNKFTIAAATGNTVVGGNLTAGSGSSSAHSLTGSITQTGNSGSADAFTLNSSPTGSTATRNAFVINRAGTFDTTVGALDSFGGKITVSSTRSGGGNAFRNYALQLDASGAVTSNVALRTNAGDNWLNVGSGNTAVGYAVGSAPSAKFAVNGAAQVDGVLYVSNQINGDYNVNALGYLLFNYTGYQGGTTQFRDSVFYDGKQNEICRIAGAAATLNCVGGLQENGTAVLSGAITDNVIPKGSSGDLADSSWTDNGTTSTTTGALDLLGGFAWIGHNNNDGEKLKLGNDSNSTTGADQGMSFNSSRSGAVFYWDTKLATGGAIVGRIGAGTNPGYTNNWLQVDGSGNASFYGSTTLGDSTADFQTLNGITNINIPAGGYAQVSGPVSNYSQMFITSNGGAGNGFGAMLKLQNTNSSIAEFRLADTGSGTSYAAEESMLSVSTLAGYGIKLNVNAADNSGIRIASGSPGAVTIYGNTGIGTTAGSVKLDVRNASTTDLGLFYHSGGNGTAAASGNQVEIRADDTTTAYNLLMVDVANVDAKKLRFTSDGLLRNGGDFQNDGSTTLGDTPASDTTTVNSAAYFNYQAWMGDTANSSIPNNLDALTLGNTGTGITTDSALIKITDNRTETSADTLSTFHIRGIDMDLTPTVARDSTTIAGSTGAYGIRLSSVMSNTGSCGAESTCGTVNNLLRLDASGGDFNRAVAVGSGNVFIGGSGDLYVSTQNVDQITDPTGSSTKFFVDGATGNTAIKGTLDVDSFATFDSNTTINGQLITTAIVEIQNVLTSSTGPVTIADDATVNAKLTVLGDAALGNNPTDAISFSNGPSGINNYEGTHFEFTDEYLDNQSRVNTGKYNEFSSVITSGANAAASPEQTADYDERFGVLAIGPGTTSTGRYAETTGVTAFDTTQLVSTTWSEAVAPATLSTSAQEYAYLTGYFDTTSSINQTDGCYALYDRGNVSTDGANSSNANKWELVSVANGTRTVVILDGTTQGGVVTVDSPLAASTFQRVVVTVTDTSSCSVAIDGTTRATITSNVPNGAGRLFGAGHMIVKSAGTTNIFMLVDQSTLAWDLSAAR